MEVTGEDEPVDVVAVAAERIVQRGFERHDRRKGERILLAASGHGVPRLAALAPFADAIGGQHELGRATDLEVVDGHHHRHALLLHRAEDRGRQVVIHVVRVDHVGADLVDQSGDLAPGF